MSQHRVRAERRIDAPVEDVWAVVDDTSRYAEWVDGCLEVTRHHGSATVGDTYGERNSTLGPLIATTTWTVLEVEPHVRRVDAGEGLAPLRDFRNVFTFTPTSDGRGTLMTYEVTFGLALGPLGRVLAAVLGRSLPQEFQRSIQNLDTLLRSERPLPREAR
jgi:uncharacterized protein YndB with AHSA1/START domain